MREYSCRVDDIGRVLIPAELRRSLGVAPGSDVILTEREGVVTLMTKRALRRRVQERVSRLAPTEVVMSEELIADRRREVRREHAKRNRQRAIRD